MTQTEMILNHLKTKGRITPLEALNLYGCFRLGARVYDPFDNGADGESVIYYNISCPYFRGDERARCKDQIMIMNRELCVECKMDWLNAEVDP